MDDKLYRRCQELIRKECCNYFSDGCVALNKPCPMSLFYKDSAGHPAYKMCSWFKDFVLVRDDTLWHDILSNSSSDDFESKECSVCGKMFVATDGRQTMCAACRAMDSKMKIVAKRRKNSVKKR